LIEQKFAGYSREFSKSPGAKPVTFEVEQAAKDMIVSKGYQKEFGARSVTTYIDTELASQMATEILKKRQQLGGAYLPEQIIVRGTEDTFQIELR
ncbi:MAG: hypothetical protein EPO24_03270, partial [Bacteroidetes bacterium]